MDDVMLSVQDLHVAVGGVEILHGVDLSIHYGETTVLFGPNGSGKSTLLMTLMGFPNYHVTSGAIAFKGRDITGLEVDERARLGFGLSFQRPPVVRGVKTRDMVAACLRREASDGEVRELAAAAALDDFLDRDVNYGFSGGEIKRSELLQLLAQNPEFVMLDEPESGVDLVNIALIGDLINRLLQKDVKIRDRSHSGLIITHTGHILDYVTARAGYVMIDGRLSCGGDPHEILSTIKQHGYEECSRCAK
ncbi:MAG: ABC transporter ATP-binding protein [Dehalococcoidia bacterium]|jgi:Fe-S cluster assembly ATP-binding protein|nr:ABC transporter ATP-binding protein [Dehalococcoidia bacterium]